MRPRCFSLSWLIPGTPWNGYARTPVASIIGSAPLPAVLRQVRLMAPVLTDGRPWHDRPVIRPDYYPQPLLTDQRPAPCCGYAAGLPGATACAGCAS